MNLITVSLLFDLYLLLVISATVSGNSLVEQARENDHNTWLRINKRFLQPNNDDYITMLFLSAALRENDEDDTTFDKFERDLIHHPLQDLTARSLEFQRGLNRHPFQDLTARSLEFQRGLNRHPFQDLTARSLGFQRGLNRHPFQDLTARSHGFQSDLTARSHGFQSDLTARSVGSSSPNVLKTWCNQNPITCEDGWKWCKANKEACIEKAKNYCKKYQTDDSQACEQFDSK